MTRTVDIAGRCVMPTRNLRQCRRVAEVQYLRADGTQVAAYCRQHDSTPGGRHLRPYAWEYSERRIIAEYFPGTDVRRGPFGPRETRRKSLYS